LKNYALTIKNATVFGLGFTPLRSPRDLFERLHGFPRREMCNRLIENYQRRYSSTIVAALIGGLTRIMPFGDLRNVEGPKFGDAEFKLVDSKVISIKATSTGNNPLRGCRRLSGRLT
jgi:hypothetical protein